MPGADPRCSAARAKLPGRGAAFPVGRGSLPAAGSRSHFSSSWARKAAGQQGRRQTALGLCPPGGSALCFRTRWEGRQQSRDGHLYSCTAETLSLLSPECAGDGVGWAALGSTMLLPWAAGVPVTLVGHSRKHFVMSQTFSTYALTFVSLIASVYG